MRSSRCVALRSLEGQGSVGSLPDICASRRHRVIASVSEVMPGREAWREEQPYLFLYALFVLRAGNRHEASANGLLLREKSSGVTGSPLRNSIILFTSFVSGFLSFNPGENVGFSRLNIIADFRRWKSAMSSSICLQCNRTSVALRRGCYSGSRGFLG